MRFVLIDKLTKLQPGQSASAVKCLSLAEEYLGDHFPTFPVLPGVMMVEAMVQTGAWLVRVTEDYKHSVIVLREARNVSYGNFVAPGNILTIEAELSKLNEDSSVLKTRCIMNGQPIVKAKLTLAMYNMVDQSANSAGQDEKLIEHFRRQFNLLQGPEALKRSQTA